MAAVLIVDSSSDSSNPYASSLRDSGFDVVVVPTAEQACAAAETVCPEVVVALFMVKSHRTAASRSPDTCAPGRRSTTSPL